MAKVKIQGIAARKSLFSTFSKKENFEVLSVEQSVQIERGDNKGTTNLTPILCRPLDKATMETLKDKVSGVYVCPIFNTYDESIQAGDKGTVTMEKSGDVERFIFSKLGKEKEYEIKD